MFIFGHVGFTLAAYAVVKRKQILSFNNALFVGTLALAPDIFDRTLHLIFKTYPVPGLFHSVLFYALALPLSFLVFRRFFYYLLIMAGNVALDIVNTDLQFFVYPLFGWSSNPEGVAIHSPFMTFLNHWPKTIGYKLPTGHYLVFEAIGIILICLVVWRLIKSRQGELVKG